ncbi:porin [Rhodoferax sp. U2-2l]|uniref:porin n=1 Tax=Rhodoferax sp. U2-2l TaxID=2884000 RepID=UPI001D0B6A60|nr:porin [Rhodoferax sp. U2-2l]MCB8745689.1 porin [Rhodoferax sp. U2-2l]
MKKSLIALAVLAASGAAMAQSSVTLYGIADVWVGSVKNTNNAASVAAGAGAGSIRQAVLESGGVNGSRWGMKGSEDLGGGLKANFDLQAGIKLDDGSGTSTSATAFSRQSWVGLSGGFGSVRLGRTTTPFDDVSGTSNAVFDSALAPAGYVFKSTGYSARQNNMMFYQAPTMGGFSGAISYALGEDKTAATSATDTTSLNLTYGAGPLALQFGYQVQDVVNAVPTSADAKFTRLGASYDFGVAKAKVTYGNVDNVGSVNGYDAKEYQLGVDVPLSSALTLSASYASSKDDKATGFEQKRTGYGIGASYTLSKRTFLYGGYESDKATNNAAADSKHNVFAVGMQHRF